MYNRHVRVHLVDTPGFDDTNRSDVQVLQDVAHWLGASFQDGIRLSGIIYMHRISDLRMAGSALRNLSMFRKLCGEKAYQSVVLTTSMWSKVDPEEGAMRERELVETSGFWGLMCQRGSRVFRYLGTQESALELVGYILSLHMQATLAIQDEIVNQGHEIDETAAAQELNADIIREREQHRADLANAREDMRQAMLEHDEELQRHYKSQMDDLQSKIRETETEQRKLTQTLAEVDKRKEEEFRAFREKLERERAEEQRRYEQQRRDLEENLARQQETLRRQQEAEAHRAQASREEAERRQEELRRTMEEQQRQHEVRMRENEERHRREMEDLKRRLSQRPRSKFINTSRVVGRKVNADNDI
ncbi:hypothetical protein OQA88_9081 [Cercophora sp. LCS_1]